MTFFRFALRPAWPECICIRISFRINYRLLFFKVTTTLVCIDTVSTIADMHAKSHALDVYM